MLVDVVSCCHCDTVIVATGASISRAYLSTPQKQHMSCFIFFQAMRRIYMRIDAAMHARNGRGPAMQDALMITSLSHMR